VTPEMRTWLWRQARPWLPLAAVLVVCGVVRLVFVHAVGSQGLLTPGRPPDHGLAMLALAAVVLRVAVLVTMPAMIAYRIARALLRRLVARIPPAMPRDETPRLVEPPR
jgi:hypothetical protein